MRKLNKRQQRIQKQRAEHPSSQSLATATVITRHKNHVLIFSQEIGYLLCNLRQHVGEVVVGDTVHYSTQESGENGLVHGIQPRHSLLKQEKKLIAANIDQLFIVSAIEPDWSPLLIDSFLLVAELNHITPIVVLNKIDMLDKTTPTHPLINLYESLNYSVLTVSAHSPLNLDTMMASMQGKSNALVGLSGVGKSSLTNTLIPNLNQQTKTLTRAKLGSHTTSTSQLFYLEGGGNLIDSPGLREIKPAALDLQSIESAFREFTPLLGQCQFHNCTHQHEPRCAILDALKEGKIATSRYQNFLYFMENFLQTKSG
jgi:ribosome biogenesis GTPase